jgi:hypothetical protein
MYRRSQTRLAMNALHPSQMTDDERLAEIGELFVLGPIHCHGHKSSSSWANGLIDAEVECPQLADHPIANQGLFRELQSPSDEATCRQSVQEGRRE